MDVLINSGAARILLHNTTVALELEVVNALLSGLPSKVSVKACKIAVQVSTVFSPSSSSSSLFALNCLPSTNHPLCSLFACLNRSAQSSPLRARST